MLLWLAGARHISKFLDCVNAIYSKLVSDLQKRIFVFQFPIESRLSLTHHANKSSCWAEKNVKWFVWLLYLWKLTGFAQLIRHSVKSTMTKKTKSVFTHPTQYVGTEYLYPAKTASPCRIQCCYSATAVFVRSLQICHLLSIFVDQNFSRCSLRKTFFQISPNSAW